MIKKLGDKLAYIIIGVILTIAATAYAVNVTIPQSTQKGDVPIGNANGTYNAGHLTAGTGITISTSTTGQIIITNSGSLVSASGTAGSIQFAGAGSTFNADQSNFWWDNTNKRLGIGTSVPATILNIVGSFSYSTSTMATQTKTALLRIDNPAATGTGSVPTLLFGTDDINGINLIAPFGNNNPSGTVYHSTTTLMRWIPFEILAFGAEAATGIRGYDTTLQSGCPGFIGCADSITAIGDDALSAAGPINPTNFRELTVIGNNAAKSMTSGTEDVVVGHNAAASMTNSTKNVIIGNDAAVSACATMNYGTILGQGAMHSSCGDLNVILGTQAYGGLINSGGTAGNNLIAGAFAGDKYNDSTTGAGRNVWLGFLAGGMQTAGSNNIAIGTAITNASTTGSNQLSLHNLIYGANITDYTTNGDLFHAYSYPSAGQVGIGTSTPAAKFAVQASSTDISTPLLVLASSSGSTMLSVSGAGLLNTQNLTIASLTGTQCLHEVSGVVSGTGSDCGTGGSGNSAWTIGNGLIYNATSTDSVLIGTTTPTSATLHVVASGTKNPLVVASSSGADLFSILSTFGSGAGKGTVWINGNNLGLNGNGMFLISNTSTPLDNVGAAEFNLDGDNRLSIGAHGTGARPGIVTIMSRGTTAAPTAPQSGDKLMFLSTQSYNGVAYGASNQAEIDFLAAQNFTSTTTGTNIVFSTTPNNSVSLAERVRIDNAGNLGINSSTPSALLSIQGYSGATTPLFSVASSSGTILLSIAPNGSTTLSSLGTGCIGASSGSLYIANSVCGTALSGGTAGFAPYWTSATTLGVGKLMDNGAVIGMNATSSTIGFNIQGTAGTNDIFNVASSNAASILKVTSNGYFTWQPTSTSTTAFLLKNAAGSNLLTIDTTSLAGTPSAMILTVASSSGANLFNVDGLGNTFVNHLVGSSTAPTVATSTGVGTGAGSVVTLKTGSTDLAGMIDWKTTNAPAANATIITLTFNRVYTAAPFCNITSATSSTATFWATTTTSTLLIKSNTALTGTSTYATYYQCIGQLGG